MIPILYEANETAFISNGICRLRDCLSAVVLEERNGIYELDFEYPVNGANFEEIQCGRVIAVRHDDTEDVQPFDIVSYTKPINGIVTFHAVHISYRLRGSVVEADNVNSLSTALTKLATATPDSNFTYQADFTANGYASAFNGIPRSVRQLLGGVEGSILDTYGGEYEWDKFKVILHKHRGVTADFKIRYGLNMVDYNEELDYSDTYTSVIPYWIGENEDGSQTIIKGNQVYSGAVPYNGFDKCIPLDLSEKFEDEPTAAQLEAYALNKMTSQNTSLPKQSIKVDFIRLNDFEELGTFAPLLQCKLCDSIEVVFPDYQTSGLFKIVRTEYDVLDERFTSMELGTLSTTLAEALGINEQSGSGTSSGGGGGGGTSNYNDLSNKPSINGVTLSGNKTSSALNIHEIPAGGSSGQVLTKNSGSNYDVIWSTQSPGGGSVTDVVVDGTSVVSSGVATIPKANGSQFGVIEVGSSPGVLSITSGTATNNAALLDSSGKVSTDVLPVLDGATSSASGKAGIVPAPPIAGTYYKVLLDDGTWKELSGQISTGANAVALTVDLDSNTYIQWDINGATNTYAGVMTASDKTKLDNIYNLIYPVGSVYETANSAANPQDLFGGSWAMLGQLVTSDGDFIETDDEVSLLAGNNSQIVKTYKWVKLANNM